MKKCLSLCLLIFTGVTLLAQFKENTIKIFTTSVNHDDFIEYAEVMTKKTKVSANNLSNYYWYASNNILNTQGGYGGKLLHGAYISYYNSTKNLKEQGKFTKGMKDGEWKNWYDDGSIREISNWKSGKMFGKYLFMDKEGRVVKSGSYKSSGFKGAEYQYLPEDIIEKVYYKNGEVYTDTQCYISKVKKLFTFKKGCCDKNEGKSCKKETDETENISNETETWDEPESKKDKKTTKKK